jgi:predicted AAA+ superfamily ATPase
VVEEKLSLSDRFGLWLGFHKTDQDAYLEMIARYLAHYHIQLDEAQWRAQAIEWAAIRGARSGRVAWQFVTELAGAQGRALD